MNNGLEFLGNTNEGIKILWHNITEILNFQQQHFDNSTVRIVRLGSI